MSTLLSADVEARHYAALMTTPPTRAAANGRVKVIVRRCKCFSVAAALWTQMESMFL